MGIIITIVLLVVLAVLVATLVGGVLAARRRVGDGGGAASLGRSMDPFTLSEPWRHFVTGAMRSRTRYHETLAKVADGPKRDRLTSIGAQLDHAVDEVWRVAGEGQELSAGRRQLNLDDVRRRLGAVTGDDETAARTRQSLQSQLEAAERMNARIDDTERRLALLQAQMDDSVAKAAELSAGSASLSEFGEIDGDMTDLVSELEALRQALEETDQATG